MATLKSKSKKAKTSPKKTRAVAKTKAPSRSKSVKKSKSKPKGKAAPKRTAKRSSPKISKLKELTQKIETTMEHLKDAVAEKVEAVADKVTS